MARMHIVVRKPHAPRPSEARPNRRISAAVLGILAVSSIAGAARAREIPFAPDPISTSANGAVSVYAVDLDGDGKLDVVSASVNDDKIVWYENLGTSPVSFDSHVVTEDPGGGQGFADGVRSVYAADLDGDGDVDLLSASGNDDQIAWYRNDGGTFQEFVIVDEFSGANAALNATSVYAADLDGDGDLDVLSASLDDDKIAWYENDGNPMPSFSPIAITEDPGPGEGFANGPTSVFAIDLDGDGDVDVLSAAYANDQIAWYENNGAVDPTFASHTIVDAGSGADAADSAWDVYAADVDGDGDVDVLSASRDDDKIAWYENNGCSQAGPCGTPPTFVPHVIVDVSYGADAAQNTNAVFAADVDGDGDVDVLSSSADAAKVTWYDNDGGSFTPRNIIEAGDPDDPSAPKEVFAADLDGDGDIDVLSASEFDDKIQWYENLTIHRSAMFGEGTATGGVDGMTDVAVADLDGDGDFDFAGPVENQGPSHGSILWIEQDPMAAGGWTEHTVDADVDSPWSVFAADVDGDGDTDLVAAQFGEDRVSWYENPGWAPHEITATLVDEDPYGPRRASAGDMDGDGDADVVAVWWATAEVALYVNDGSWTEESIATGAAGADHSVLPVDVDRDGDLDLVAAGGSPTLKWLRNDGHAPWIWQNLPISDRPQVGLYAVPADVNADGWPDVVAGFYPSGTVAWYENDGTPGGLGDWNEHVVATGLGVGLHTVAAADMDGDGDVDLLSTRSAPGGGSTTTPSLVTWYENDGAPTGGDWPPHVVTSNTVGLVRSATVADVDADGDGDVVASWHVTGQPGPGQIVWYENRGGQFALATSGAADTVVADGTSYVPLTVTATHNGRAGDGDLELTSLELLFEEGPGDPLTLGEVQAMIDRLRIHVDGDGSGTFDGDPPDTEVTTVVALSGGEQKIPFTDDDPLVQVAHGTPRTYFVVLDAAADASAQSPGTLQVTHLTESSSEALDRDHDIPLSLEFAPNTKAGPVCFGPVVVSVLPSENALDVPVSTNVTATFSGPIDPATATASSFRLLDPSGSPVPAVVTVSPSQLQATLDPQVALDFGTTGEPALYTVEVGQNAPVTNAGGCPVAPFTSLFETRIADVPPPEGTLIQRIAVGASLGGGAAALGAFAGEGGPTVCGTNMTGASRLGQSSTGVGDVNGDAFQDAATGAPSFDTDRGLVSIFLGSEALGDFCECPDPPDPCSCPPPPVIVRQLDFCGEAQHDRAGQTVAGGFDFDRDGKGDLAIGAPEAGGGGKVYLISDVAGYVAGCGASGTVELADVGTPGCPGAILTGEAGDLAGSALDAGGRVDGNAWDDLVIGAPGAGGGAGRAYLIFDDASLTGTRSLSEVLGGTLAGRVYAGAASSDDALGHAVAFVGDVTGNGNDDLALGAPLSDAGAEDAGAVWVEQGGALTASTSVIDAATIAIRIFGDSDGEQLGFSIAAGGDHRQDGEPDLLIGAPYYDVPGPPARAEAGRVVQTSAPLAGTVMASDVPALLDGIVWLGEGAGDHLGYWVAGVGDITSDDPSPIDDIVLGAPHADARGEDDRGIAYVLEGPARVGDCTATFRCSNDPAIPCSGAPDCGGNACTSLPFPCGTDADCPWGTCEGGTLGVDGVEGTFAGLKVIGQNGDNTLSWSADRTGDLDSTDGREDFVVGSPGWDSGQQAGRLWLVVNFERQDVGHCDDNDGCTVADLATGGQLKVPESTIGPDPRVFSVSANRNLAQLAGVLNEDAVSLVGVLRFAIKEGGVFVPCEASCIGTLPHAVSIHIPALPHAEPQLTPNEMLPVYRLAGGEWELQTMGQVKPNPHYPDKLGVDVVVDELWTYGVFFNDVDGDGSRSALDCVDTDALTFPGAAPLDDPAACMRDADLDDYGSESPPSGAAAGTDCNDGCVAAWDEPGSAGGLTLSREAPGGLGLEWSAAPGAAGGSFVQYDALRSEQPDDFGVPVCVASDQTGLSASETDFETLPAGEARYYLVRAENCCAESLGEGSGEEDRSGGSCP